MPKHQHVVTFEMFAVIFFFNGGYLLDDVELHPTQIITAKALLGWTPNHSMPITQTVEFYIVFEFW